MIWFANLIFYNLYRLELKTQALINYPFIWFLKLEKVKDFYSRRGMNNPEKMLVKAVNCPRRGINSLIANIHMGILFMLLIVGGMSVILTLMRLEVYFSKIHYSFIIVLAIWIDHCVFHRNRVYLKYFQEFDKMPKVNRALYAWLTFFVVIGIWVFGFSSWFMTSGLNLHQDHWALLPIVDW